MAGAAQPHSKALPRPVSTRPLSGYPPAAVAPLVVAAILMMIEGIYFVAYGSSVTYNVLIPSGLLVPSLYVSGYIAFLEGALVLALALIALTWRGWHRFVGVGCLTIGLLSLFSGGGFFVGAVVAYIGGIIAVYHTPPSVLAAAVEPSPDNPDYDPVIDADTRAFES